MHSNHGTRHEDDDGQLTAIVDRTGAAWARLAWDGERLVELRVPVGGGEVIVDGAVITDPLLGDAHAIRVVAAGGDGSERGEVVTAISALDWRRPAEIPTIAAPGRLPPGAGGALLNAIAVLAARAGVTALRYAGPYPTPALWRSLLRAFRTDATEAAFTAELIARAARLARDPIAIDFAPAPCERVAIAGGPGDHVELRDGVERAVLGGVAYEPGGSPARLVPDASTAGAMRAEVWFGDAPYAHVATLGPDGALTSGPHAIPPCESRVLGAEFPPPLALALASLVADAVPAPLAGDARAWVTSRPILWADLGARAAAMQGGEILVHAALWDRIGPLGLGRLALALAEALAPVATAAVVGAVLEGSPR